MTKENRIAKLIIGRKFLASGRIFKEGYRITNGLPEDAEFVKMVEYPTRDAYALLYRSEEFDEVDELAQLGEIPRAEVEFEIMDEK